MLKYIRFPGHKILGKNFEAYLTNDDIETNGENIVIEDHKDYKDGSDNKNTNHFTFIIGDNGVGKTVFSKSILALLVKSESLSNHFIIKIDDIFRNHEGLKKTQKRSINIGFDKCLEKYKMNDDSCVDDDYRSMMFISNSSFNESIIDSNLFYTSISVNSRLFSLKQLFFKSYALQANFFQNINKLYDKKYEWLFEFNFKTTEIFGKQVDYEKIYECFESTKWKEYHNPMSLENESFVAMEYGIEENQYFREILRILYLKSPHITPEEIFKEIYTDTIWKILSNSSYLNSAQQVSFSNLDISEISGLILGMLVDINVIINFHLCVKENKNNTRSIDETFSSGEKVLLQWFCILNNRPNLEKKDNLYIFWDEPENSLHLKAQASFFNTIKEITESLGIINSHFIITTHSPTILMGASKHDNVCCLKFEKDEEGIVKSYSIPDISNMYLEEIMMDQFGYNYRMEDILDKIQSYISDEDIIANNKKPQEFKDIKPYVTNRELDDRIGKLKKSINKKKPKKS